MSEPNDDPREKAREHVEQMPAETALGNPDPAGGSTDDPASYPPGPEGDQ